MPTSKKITAAAKEYAKEQLGEEQFKHNKDAVKAISDDFRAGVMWAFQHVAGPATLPQ